MPSTLVNTVSNSSALTAIGGSIGAGDTAVYNQGNQDYTSGDLSTAALAAVNLLSGYSGNFGWDSTSANNSPTYLKIVTAAAGMTADPRTGIVNINSNSSRVYIQSSSGSGVIGAIDVNPAKGTAIIGLDAMLLTNLIVRGGANTQCTANCTATNVYQEASVLDLIAGGPTTTLLVVTGGVCNLNRVATTIKNNGGTVRVMLDTITPTTLETQPGSTTLYAGGAITTGNYYGGTVDLTQLTKPLVHTNTNIYGPVTFICRRALGEPTWGTRTLQSTPRFLWI